MPLEIKRFNNARIYDLGGDFEAIYYRPGWGSSYQSKKINISSPRESINYKLHRLRTLQKARSKIRRVIKTYLLNRFVSLTFAENITEVKDADAEFRKFMKRLRRRFKDLKYVAVREFQKRGAVHYHLAVNMFIKQSELQEIWGNGFVWIERKIKSQNQAINYLCKYLAKHLNDNRLKGFNSYLCSQGLSLSYEDKYFDNCDEMLDFLEKQFGDKMKEKVVKEFEESQVVWVG